MPFTFRTDSDLPFCAASTGTGSVGAGSTGQAVAGRLGTRALAGLENGGRMRGWMGPWWTSMRWPAGLE
ncbi:unnamed protein product [Urochloa humidicola]